MTRDFIYVSPELDLKKCAEIMIKKRVGSLIVKDKEKLLGILTEKDIVWAVVKKSIKDLKEIIASDIAKRKVVTIHPSADISEALRRMKKDKVRRLPVLENGKVIGMLTLKDILKMDPNLYEMIAETVKIREESDKISRSKLKGKRKSGVCEECGEQDLLYKSGNQWICIECHHKS